MFVRPTNRYAMRSHSVCRSLACNIFDTTAKVLRRLTGLSTDFIYVFLWFRKNLMVMPVNEAYHSRKSWKVLAFLDSVSEEYGLHDPGRNRR